MSVSKKLNTIAIASAFAALFVSGISSAAPHPAGGRVGSSDQPGIERTSVVIYQTGRVAPKGNPTPVYEHAGRTVTNGRQG